VIGEAERMPAPVADNAVGGALNPDLPTTTVTVPWDDRMKGDDRITLKWIGTRPDFTIYDPQLEPHDISDGEASSKPAFIFKVDGMHLKAIEGGTLELYFILSRFVDGTIVHRESARAEKLNIGAPRAELPAPEVKGVDENGVIDPAYGSTDLIIKRYTGMAIGDVVRYLWQGSEAGDVKDSINITGNNVGDDYVKFTVPANAISLNDGGTVEASYEVTRAGTKRTSYSAILKFSVGPAVVLDPPVISNIKDSKGNEIPDSQTTSDTSVTVSGTAAPDHDVEVFDHTISKGKLTANANGQWTLAMNDLEVADHAIKAKALYGDGTETAVRTFTVSAVTLRPVITTILDANGDDIPNGGSTADQTVTIVGALIPTIPTRK
jgi:hypothetical protein